jgi:hypothetical protein
VKIVLVRPSYDYETQTMNAWAKTVRVGLFTAHDLDGFSATEKNLRQCLQNSPDAELIAFYGHGSQESLVVRNSAKVETPIIHASGPGILPRELNSRNVYAVACLAGVNLGPALASANCRFVGYLGNFMMVPHFEREFGSVVNRGLLAWANDGKTGAQVRKQLRRDWLRLSDDLADIHFHGDAQKERRRFIAVTAALYNGLFVCVR